MLTRKNATIYNSQYIFNYVNNEKHGEYKQYYYNGSVKMRCNYVNNKKHGEARYYNEDGTLEYTRNNVYGKEID